MKNRVSGDIKRKEKNGTWNIWKIRAGKQMIWDSDGRVNGFDKHLSVYNSDGFNPEKIKKKRCKQKMVEPPDFSENNR